MKIYEPRAFNIPELKGISGKTIEEHIKLYQGYVKHTNLILEKINELKADSEKNAYVIGELQRRLGFEFDGMRNHEYYFEQFEGGFQNMDSLIGESKLKKMIEERWGTVDTWLQEFKSIAMTRGIGWVILYEDKETGCLQNAWIDEQHIGHLTGGKFILGLDMWEHSYMLDYPPSEKKKYVDAFFENLNWLTISKRVGE
jgi:superoxide dismutase, Fe-Mn family